jgi:integrase/recombinase XerD
MSFDLQSPVQSYLDALSIRHYSSETIRTRSTHLRAFVHWAEGQGISAPTQLSPDLLVNYQLQLISHRKAQDSPLCISTQHSYLLSIRSWLRWLKDQEIVASDLAAKIATPQATYRLPRNFSATDVERIFEVCSLRTSTGLRDRTILETFYSTGIRRMELLNLKTHDLDWHRGLLTVRMGKGRKDRVIPIGERALAWIDRYLWEVRQRFRQSLDDGTLFLTRTGRPFTPNHLSWLSRRLINQAFPKTQGACHLFRHSMATLMLEGGADIRFIQQMLGHSKLTSTQIYAHVSVQALKEVHSKTHPGARLRTFTKLALLAGSTTE